jgi:flagellar hook-associated protein 1
MAISTFTGIQTSLRGLLAQQRALDVTSHNIANANTAGYSRQEATLVTSDALHISGLNGGMLGTGVDVQSYKRVRDQFLDLQYRGQSTSLGEQAARSDALAEVELSLSEPGENGIAARLSEFWGAWANLSNGATNPAARQAVIDKTRTLAGTINDLQGSLVAARTRAADEYTSLTAPGGEINRISSDLASTLNAIRDAELTGTQPNDLYDRRDALLDQLSSLGQVSVSPSASGAVTIDGRTTYSYDVTLGGATIVAADPAGRASVGAFPPAFSATPGGRLGALVDLQSATGPIAQYQTDLAAMAKSLADLVNGVYNPGGLAEDFFTYNPADPAGTIALNEPTVTKDTLRAGVGGPGDNSIARAVSALSLPQAGSPDTLYAQLVTRIGNEVSQARRQEATAQVLTDNLKDRRESINGVSLDEEMTNIIRFQRAYQASARAMSTTDEMIDTLINRTGRVGL